MLRRPCAVGLYVLIQLFIAGFGLKIGNHQIFKGRALVADGLALLAELGEQVGQRGH